MSIGDVDRAIGLNEQSLRALERERRPVPPALVVKGGEAAVRATIDHVDMQVGRRRRVGGEGRGAHPIGLRRADPERCDGGGACAGAVGAQGKAVQPRRPFRQRRQHSVTVRDGFVARHTDQIGRASCRERVSSPV